MFQVSGLRLLAQHPDRFDFVVARSLFEDVLSDSGPALAHVIGIVADTNINPEKEFPCIFEPVPGS